jgi:hypothetical protein
MPAGGVLVSVGHVQDRLLRERFSPIWRPMGRCSEVKPQHMLNAGELARLKEVVSPARLR